MTAVDFIRYSTDVVLFLIFAFVAARAVRRPTRTAVDTALFFGALVFTVGIGLGQQIVGQPLPFGAALSGSAAMALPLLLLRLVDDFTNVPRSFMAFAVAGFGLSVIALFVFAPLPSLGTLALVVYFAVVTVYCAVAFARASGRAQGVNRRRLQAISFGSYVLGLLIVLAGVSAVVSAVVPSFAVAISAVVQLLALVWAFAYAAGFAPPVALRRLWREPELRAFLARAARLPRLPSTEEIVHELEMGASAAIGSNAQIALADVSGTMYFRQANSPEPFPVRQDSTLPARRAFDQQRTVFLADLMREDPANADVYRGRGVNSVIIAPITAGERRLGVLMAYASRAPLFAEDDATLAELLADQAAVILESRALIDESTRVRALEQATLLKEDFLSAAAHDLKTPLTTLVAQTQYLQHRARRDPHSPVDLEALERITREAKRMGTLVEELLDASRLDQGSFKLLREPTDLVAIANAVAARERPTDQQVVVDAAGPIIGSIDAVRVEQLIENLVENATKYSAPDGIVTIRLRRASWVALVEVADNGIGIPVDDLPHVFDRFRRASNVDSRRYAGMGLGLFISKGIVEAHGGTINVESAVGRGTTVRVTLPLPTDA